MVHLASVPNDSDVAAPIVKGLEKIKLEQPSEDEITTSVYGSHFAAEEMPNHNLPDKEMYTFHTASKSVHSNGCQAQRDRLSNDQRPFDLGRESSPEPGQLRYHLYGKYSIIDNITIR